MTDERQRRSGFSAWWGKYAGSVAFVTLVILATAGFFRLDDTIDRIEVERANRAESVSGIITLFCRTNNDQDKTLGKLVAVSLGNGGFGENVDSAEFSAFDLQVLGSIAKVQAASQDTQLRRVFERELADLRDTTPCQQLVTRFQAGEPIPPPNGEK